MTKKMSPVVEAILEMNDDQLRLGIIDQAQHDKITMRHLGKMSLPAIDPIDGAEIRFLREKTQLSQAVFARHLNLTTGFVSQLERGARQPKGATLALLNVIRRKGISAIL